jgi:hypothetical protein
MAGHLAVKKYTSYNWQKTGLVYTYIDSNVPRQPFIFLRNHIDWTDDMEVKNALNEITAILNQMKIRRIIFE